MKKLLLSLAIAATFCATALAQNNRVVNLSTNSDNLNVMRLQNSEQTVCLNRYLFAGYNTLCLPVAMSAQQIDAAAPGLRVERLAGIGMEGSTLCLYFIDCTSEGIEAGSPYLIFSPTRQTMKVKNTEVVGFNANITPNIFSDDSGNTITFGSSWQSIRQDGRYGIPAQQNVDVLESILVRTDAEKVFLPTRCGIVWEKQAPAAAGIAIKHVAQLPDATAISTVKGNSRPVDVYDVKGALLRRNVSSDNATNGLPAGVYVVNGEKVFVK